MPWMQKEDGDPIMVDTKQVPHFDKQGYKFCPTPEHMKEAEPEVKAAEIVLKAGQVKMYKGKDYCICDAAQVEAFSAQGWSNEEGAAPEKEVSDPATEGSNDNGGKQHDGRDVDQEHGNASSGSTGSGSTVGQQQSSSTGGNGASGDVGRKA